MHEFRILGPEQGGFVMTSVRLSAAASLDVSYTQERAFTDIPYTVGPESKVFRAFGQHPPEFVLDV